MKAVEKFDKTGNLKDSGAEWLGSIPHNWDCIRMKHLFKDVSIKNKPDAELLSVTQNQGVVPRTWVENRMVMPSGALASFKFIQQGDFAISLRSFEGGLEYCHHDGIISPAYTVLKAQKDFHLNYYKYLFKSSAFISELQTSVVGIREGKNISYPELSYSFLPVPPKTEQTAIANFLDKKIALIDKAIAIKERQIELLKERRQILINRAVTRGLNPNVKMKDSGVEWIGEIPKHWEIKKLKFIGSIKYGLGQPPKEKENGLRLIRATNVERGEINEKDLLRVDPDDIPWKRDPELKENDIIVVRSGAYTGDSAIITREYSGAIAGYDMVLTPTNISPSFLAFSLLSNYILYNQLYVLRLRAAQPHLNAEELGETLVLLPTQKEQEDISNYIKHFSNKVKVAMKNKETEIKILNEYKSSLINSVIIGKIKVV
ncbi:MAG: restriction endonuclease subunit S [Sphingobacteriales bacterium]|nr:restriction endonuclease subunit S [Sphingobacteriales bacterium]